MTKVTSKTTLNTFRGSSATHALPSATYFMTNRFNALEVSDEEEGFLPSSESVDSNTLVNSKLFETETRSYDYYTYETEDCSHKCKTLLSTLTSHGYNQGQEAVTLNDGVSLWHMVHTICLNLEEMSSQDLQAHMTQIERTRRYEMAVIHQEHTLEKRVGRYIKDSNIQTRLTTNQATVLSRNYDRGIKDSKVKFTHLSTGDRWDGKVVWGMQRNISQLNPFFWESYGYHSDVNDAACLNAARQSLVFGGSSWDGLLGLKNFDHEDKKSLRHTHLFSELRDVLNIPNSGLCMTKTAAYNYDHISNLDANPGPTFINNGYTCKREVFSELSLIASYIGNGVLPVNKLEPVLWGLGGRGKPTTIDKVIEKSDTSSAVGRSIWMADAHELALSQLFSVPLNLHFSTHPGAIDVGKDFNNPDVKSNFKKILENNDLYFSGDWSGFDSSLPAALIGSAFEFLRQIFNITPLSPYAKVLSYLKKNMIESQIICPNRRVYKKYTGLSSGSGLTSIIGSLCNLLVFLDFKRNLITHPFLCNLIWDVPHVLGDDNLISLRFRDAERATLTEGKKFFYIKAFATSLSKFALHKYGMVMHPEKSKTSIEPFVKFFAPHEAYKVTDGSVYSFYTIRNKELQVQGKPFISLEDARSLIESGDSIYWDYTKEVDFEEHFKTGKRYTMRFSNTVKYLSRHFLKDGSFVRPKEDLMRKLASPTSRINDIRAWRSLIVQYMAEYGTNPSSQSELEHLFIDSYYAEEKGIYMFQDALDSFEKHLTKSSIVRNHLTKRFKLKRQGKDLSPSVLKQNTRQFWITERDTYPDLSDPRFGFIRPQIKHMKRALEIIKGGTIMSMTDLARCRATLTNGTYNTRLSFSKEQETVFDKIYRELEHTDYLYTNRAQVKVTEPYIHQNDLMETPMTQEEASKFIHILCIIYGIGVPSALKYMERKTIQKGEVTRDEFLRTFAEGLRARVLMRSPLNYEFDGERTP